MELIERYTTAIGKHLPVKNKADIQNEIRSTLQDMIDDRSQKTGRPVDEALVSELLKEYGAPDKVAASYLPERYLIGPKLYPIFMLVIQIVAAVITVLAVVVRTFLEDRTLQDEWPDCREYAQAARYRLAPYLL